MLLELVLWFGLIGPIALPGALRAKFPKMGSISVFCLTNFATLSTMVAGTFWRFYFPGPTCRELNPGAICDGIPSSAGWMFFGLASVLLAVWGVLVSSVATFLAFRSGK